MDPTLAARAQILALVLQHALAASQSDGLNVSNDANILVLKAIAGLREVVNDLRKEQD